MIEVISGTNRPDSNSLKIARAIVALYREEGAEAGLLNLQDLPQEIFLPSSYLEKPAAFAPFQERVLKASGLHIVTPEYNGSLPGVLKYFIDMLKFPESFQHRAVCFTGIAAGMWGALRPVEQLQMIFSYRNAYILPERVLLPGIREKINDQGELADAALTERLRDQTKAFIAYIHRFA